MDTVDSGEQPLINENEMCAVHSLESLLHTLAPDKQITVPSEIRLQRQQLINKTKEEIRKGVKSSIPDDLVEYEWFQQALSDIGKTEKLPEVIASLQRVNGVGELLTITNQGQEVIMLGKNDRYIPHMFHLGTYKKDQFGERFESKQQATFLRDLSDSFMRFGSCNAIVVGPAEDKQS